jgi:hypothetical protein
MSSVGGMEGGGEGEGRMEEDEGEESDEWSV